MVYMKSCLALGTSQNQLEKPDCGTRMLYKILHYYWGTQCTGTSKFALALAKVLEWQWNAGYDEHLTHSTGNPTENIDRIKQQ